MTKDRNKNISEIPYNHLTLQQVQCGALPKKITFTGDKPGTITYIYSANGEKLKKTVTEGSNNNNIEYLGTSTRLSTGGFQYKQGRLSFFPTAEGYPPKGRTGANVTYQYSTSGPPLTFFNYVYNYTDHTSTSLSAGLGNIRLRYTKDPETETGLKILEEDHYYPFGLKHKGYNNEHHIFHLPIKTPNFVVIIPVTPDVGDDYKYKYNGKEFQDELSLNWYDYGARNYDAALGRWMNVDPLAEKGPEYSPYNYTFNNPINFTDPDGRWPDPPFGYRIGASLSFGSGGFGFNVTASIGVQHKTPSFQGQAFLTGSAYMGGNQLGTSSMTRGTQYDATLTGIATVGGGRGQAHNMYSVNYNMASPFQNDFKNSGSYGQALSFNSAINAEWDGSYGNRVQRSGIVGLKFGNFSFQTSNDTGRLGGDGGDRGNTGAGVANFGGLEIGYQNFTGAYNRIQENDISFGSFYEQTNYQQSLNQSFFSIRSNGFGLDGGFNDGSVQDGIHSVTGTGQFKYPNNFRVNPNLTLENNGGL